MGRAMQTGWVRFFKDANGRFASADLPRDANNAGRLSEKLWLIVTVRDGLLSIPAC